LEYPNETGDARYDCTDVLEPNGVYNTETIALTADETAYDFKFVVKYADETCPDVDVDYTVTMGDGSALNLSYLTYTSSTNTFEYTGELPSDQTGYTSELDLKVSASFNPSGYT